MSVSKSVIDHFQKEILILCDNFPYNIFIKDDDDDGDVIIQDEYWDYDWGNDDDNGWYDDDDLGDSDIDIMMMMIKVIMIMMIEVIMIMIEMMMMIIRNWQGIGLGYDRTKRFNFFLFRILILHL